MRIIDQEYNQNSEPISVTCDDDGKLYDFEVVRHAVWQRKDETQAYFNVEWECSGCKGIIVLSGICTPIGEGFKRCPYCGSKMKIAKE